MAPPLPFPLPGDTCDKSDNLGKPTPGFAESADPSGVDSMEEGGLAVGGGGGGGMAEWGS